MRIEDELGRPYRVESGDAANDVIGILRRRGYEYVVLPRAVLCGIINASSCEPPPRQSPSSATSSPEGVVRAFRLFDCLTAIKKEGEVGRSSVQSRE